jgi:hypothetical protein
MAGWETHYILAFKWENHLSKWVIFQPAMELITGG